MEVEDGPKDPLHASSLGVLGHGQAHVAGVFEVEGGGQVDLLGEEGGFADVVGPVQVVDAWRRWVGGWVDWIEEKKKAVWIELELWYRTVEDGGLLGLLGRLLDEAQGRPPLGHVPPRDGLVGAALLLWVGE